MERRRIAAAVCDTAASSENLLTRRRLAVGNTEWACACMVIYLCRYLPIDEISRNIGCSGRSDEDSK